MEKELKKMSRRELIELMLEQSKAMETMKLELEEKNKKLAERKILISESGSIAEASLRINKVFESCQEACEQYLDNIKLIQEENEKLKSKLSKKLERDKKNKKTKKAKATKEKTSEEKTKKVKVKSENVNEKSKKDEVNEDKPKKAKVSAAKSKNDKVKINNKNKKENN